MSKNRIWERSKINPIITSKTPRCTPVRAEHFPISTTYNTSSSGKDLLSRSKGGVNSFRSESQTRFSRETERKIESKGPVTRNSPETRQSRAPNRYPTDRIRSASQGLRNLGNTCYMNSILQCLAKVPWFSKRSSFTTDGLLNEFFSLMKHLREKKSDETLNPSLFRSEVGALGFRFSTSEQNDAHEFLLCLLDRISKTMDREKSRENLVKHYLSGEQQFIYRFQDCNHKLEVSQAFLCLSLPLVEEGSSFALSSRKVVNLDDSFRGYMRQADVDGDALCLDCRLQKLCTIETAFKRLPKFLIIHLKRYNIQKITKLEILVCFRVENLCLKEECGMEKYYDLFGVCNHYGSLRFGHYTADVKSESGNWYTYSDSSVQRCSDYDASTSQHFGATDTSTVKSRDAYILFYVEKGTDV